MLRYFLTGDAASRETVIGLGQYVLNMDDGRQTIFQWLDRGDTGRAIQSAVGYFGPGRGPANSLNALVDAHRLSGDSRFLSKADQLVRRVIHPEQDITALRLDVPEQRWFYTMFLQSLGKYLHARVEMERLDEMYAWGRASLLHFANWMAEHEHPYLEKPEKLEFLTETWPAQDIRKSDVFIFACAARLSGRSATRFTERGRSSIAIPWKRLRRCRRACSHGPVVVLLTSGFLQGLGIGESWRKGAGWTWA